MAKQGLEILRNVLEVLPEEIAACRDSVNEGALMEMLLFRSSDAAASDDIQHASSLCLDQLCRSLPHGLAATIAVLLESGGMHLDDQVVYTCACALETVLELHMESNSEILEARLELIVSALGLWAHRGSSEIRQVSKIITIKLALCFGDSEAWQDAVLKCRSPLLSAWSEGEDLSAEDEERLMRTGPAVDLPDQEQPPPEAKRGWIVPAGFAPRKAPEECTMYPQVFAVLGFRGTGGPAVGIMEMSGFDSAGSFRKRVVVVERKRTEFAQVLWDGRMKVWEEEEEARREEIHLETAHGEFARREITKVEQKEMVDGQVVAKEASSKDYLHLKNETGEFEAFIHPEQPSSPQLNANHDSSCAATSPFEAAETQGEGDPPPKVEMIIEEPPSP